MQYIEIIILALVAAFLVLRLRAVLGRRTGHERQQPDPFQPPQIEPRADDAPRDVRTPPTVVPMPRGAAPVAPAARAGVEQIRAADAAFDAAGFAHGARKAFEMIVGAFAAGDSGALRPLLADNVYANFTAAIEARRSQHHTLETQLIGFESVEIVAAELNGGEARVTVKFVSEQINVTRDAEKLVVEGNPNEVEKITDLWTFARDTRSNDPTWLLVRTDAQA